MKRTSTLLFCPPDFCGGAGVPIRHGLIALLLALLLAGGPARAQSNDIPGETDYGAFSRFITQRNIFDPNRYPHESHTYQRTVSRPSNSAPAFTLVGTMSYAKGNFAFFSGNGDDFKKILPVSGTIAGYTVKEITLTQAILQGPDKTNLQMNIGDQLRQENNGWQLAVATDVSAPAAAGADDSTNSGASTDSSMVAPSPSLGSSDILKRMMEAKAKELENK
jgi:hypothetical protein